MPVREAFGAAGAGFGWFRRGCGSADCVADGAESAADPGGGQGAGWLGSLPGQAQVRGERGGQPQLGVGGDDQPGPPVRGVRAADLGGGPAQDLLEEPEGSPGVRAAGDR